MTSFHLPVRPDLGRLRQLAEQLLRDVKAARPSALELFREHQPEGVHTAVRLADAQFVLARSYGVTSWPRLEQACTLIDAIWRDDLPEVESLVRQHPHLLHEHARGTPGNWGPPMSYAANLGRDRIIARLYELGAKDLQHAFDRACLQGRIDTARSLYALGARPGPGAVMGPAETQSGDGMELLLALGAPIADERGNPLAPVAMLLETYCRNPTGKHKCLELLASHGVDLPDTPPMAVHRGRVDLLEQHLARDGSILSRTYEHEQIYPPALGCHEDHTLALHGTPLGGGTLLHLCVDYDEYELAEWLLARGADPNARAALDSDGFGGHTALFGCIVSQARRVGLRRDDAMARLLLDAGAEPGARASLRKALRFVTDESWHSYRDVSVLEWGQRFHDRSWVNESAMQLVAERMTG